MFEVLQGNLGRDNSLAAITALVGLAVGYYYIGGRKNGKNPMPISGIPGPERTFLIGNVLNFPTTAWGETFLEWREKIGNTIYVKLPFMHILVVHSLEDAEELLGKRANIWSDRPHSYMVDDLMEFGWSLLSSPPGQAMTEQRKVFRKVLGPQVIADQDQLIERGAEEFVNKLRGFSGDPAHIVVQSIGSVIIELAYGAKIFQEHGPELVKINTESMDLMTWSFQQFWLPDFFTLSRFLPSWIPGVQFPKYVARGQYLFGSVRNLAFNLVRKDMEEGAADVSVVSQYVNAPGVPTKYLRDAAAMMYMGGVDTTGSAVLNFIAHMLLFPEAQAKVQKEMDEKIGRGGSITSAEIKSLHYLWATWKESLRFNPPVPTGVAHSSTADDIWKGYLIPKGTLLIPHIAFMLRDPQIWGDDANTFKPERFIVEHNPRVGELPDMESLPFGFGRRICPGRHMAERNGIMFVARLLQAYEICPEEGASTPEKMAFVDGLVRRPKDMRCRFVSR
ncbi:cytochrome P450 [Serendipita vermifera]|nr:cytochrome P450 [Serendipita vermifera]